MSLPAEIMKLRGVDASQQQPETLQSGRCDPSVVAQVALISHIMTHTA